MSQWSSPYLSTNSWYYWSPWYSTQTLPSTIPIIIHVISIFVQLLSDENVISFSQNYNHPKHSGKFPHLSPRLSPAKLKDKHAVLISCRLKMEGCRLHRQQLLLLFDFYFVVIMSNFRTETSEESCICEISINLYFCTCLFNFFFDITNFNVYISKIHPNWKKKKTRGVSIVVKGLKAEVFLTGVGSNPMPIFLFSFIPLVTLKK